MKTYTSSRILNERSGFLGLTVIDLIVLTYVLIVAHKLCGLAAFPIVGVIAFFLVSIRLRSRSKVIRDFVTYHLNGRV